MFSEFDDPFPTAAVGISVPTLIMDSFGDISSGVLCKRDFLEGVVCGNEDRIDTSACWLVPSTVCPIFVKSCLRT